MVNHRVIARVAALLLLSAGAAHADPPSSALGNRAPAFGPANGPQFGAPFGAHAGPAAPEGLAVIAFQHGNGGATGLNGLGFRDGRLVVTEGSAGRVTLDALRASGSFNVNAGGGSTTNGPRLRVEADGRLVLVGVNGATRPLEILGTTTTLDGNAAILIRAQGAAELSREGASIGGELFAGARAEASGSITIPLLFVDIHLRPSGYVAAGAGVSGHASAGLVNGRVRLSAGAGGTLGVGGGAGLTVEVGPGSLFRSGARFEPIPRDPEEDSLMGPRRLREPRLVAPSFPRRDPEEDSLMGPRPRPRLVVPSLPRRDPQADSLMGPRSMYVPGNNSGRFDHTNPVAPLMTTAHQPAGHAGVDRN